MILEPCQLALSCQVEDNARLGRRPMTFAPNQSPRVTEIPEGIKTCGHHRRRTPGEHGTAENPGNLPIGQHRATPSPEPSSSAGTLPSCPAKQSAGQPDAGHRTKRRKAARADRCHTSTLASSAAGRPAAQVERPSNAQHGRERQDGASPAQRSDAEREADTESAPAIAGKRPDHLVKNVRQHVAQTITRNRQPGRRSRP